MKLYDPSNYWQSWNVRTLITQTLCAPVLLGLLFLVHNNIVINHAERTVIDKTLGFNLLNPTRLEPPVLPKRKLKHIFTEVMTTWKLVAAELRLVCHECYIEGVTVTLIKIIATVRQTIKTLSVKIELQKLGIKLITDFNDVFKPIPHVNCLPTNVYCALELKDTTKKIASRTYSMPRKYRDVWKTLLEQHVKAGRLHPSNSAHALPAFLVPKMDPNDLLHWVNDYQVLNVNMVLDAFPLP